MKTLPGKLLVLILFVFGAIQSFPQKQEEKPNPNTKAEKSLREVKINLLVTNAANELVNDIKREEVKLYEDGVEQKIIRFQRKMPLNLGIVIDNSGSMRTRLKDLTIAGATLAANLRDNDEVFVVRFVDSEKIEVWQDWTPHKDRLRGSFQKLFIESGQSAVIDALYLSTQKILERIRQNDPKRYALVLISDGEERDSFYKLDDVLRLLEGTEVQVFSIAIIDTKFVSKLAVEGMIKKVTAQTGGAAYFPKKWKKEEGEASELSKALKAVVFELRSQYIISYVPTNKDFDAENRKLKVVIADGAKGEKRQATLRESFVATEK